MFCSFVLFLPLIFSVCQSLSLSLSRSLSQPLFTHLQINLTQSIYSALTHSLTTRFGRFAHRNASRTSGFFCHVHSKPSLLFFSVFVCSSSSFFSEIFLFVSVRAPFFLTRICCVAELFHCCVVFLSDFSLSLRKCCVVVPFLEFESLFMLFESLSFSFVCFFCCRSVLSSPVLYTVLCCAAPAISLFTHDFGTPRHHNIFFWFFLFFLTNSEIQNICPSVGSRLLLCCCSFVGMRSPALSLSLNARQFTALLFLALSFDQSNKSIIRSFFISFVVFYVHFFFGSFRLVFGTASALPALPLFFVFVHRSKKNQTLSCTEQIRLISCDTHLLALFCAGVIAGGVGGSEERGRRSSGHLSRYVVGGGGSK